MGTVGFETLPQSGVSCSEGIILVGLRQLTSIDQNHKLQINFQSK